MSVPGAPPVRIFDGDGNIIVFGSGGTSSAFGSAFPSTGTAVGFQNVGGSMVPVVLTAAGKVPVEGTFASAPVQSSTASAPSIVSVAATDTAGIAANPARVRLSMKNVGTQAVLVFYGTGPASAASYHDILQPGGTSKDGFGDRIIDDQWTGAIRFYCVGGAGVVSIWENT